MARGSVLRRSATQQLAGAALVVVQPLRRGTGLLRKSLLALALAAGVALGWSWREPAPTPPPTAAQPDDAAIQTGPLRAELERTRLALRLGEARSQALEHQIDELNQRLAEAQSQLAFFRTAREGRR